jgi:hypothetical protein
MTQYVIQAIRNSKLGNWELTIYDDILNKIFPRVIEDEEERIR